MMRILLAFIVLIAFSSAASAETITVINEDGTKSSIEIGPTGTEATGEPAHTSAPPPRTVSAAPAPIAKPLKKPAPPKKAAQKTKPPKKKKDAKNKKNELDKKLSAAPEIAAPAPAPVRPPQSAARPQRLGPAMTPDDAIRIAVDAAPPARSVHASPVNYKGIHAYEVVFKTEGGNHFVYVDRESGKVVK